MEFDEIEPIKERIAGKLMDGPLRHRNVNGVGLSRDDLGWYIKVNLIGPHRWWYRKLPTRYGGARVRTQVVGIIRAC